MHVVVVDPSRTVLKAVSRLLEGNGHVVTTFVDGPEALDFIKSTADVSALITSAELTTMSGVELCWETRLLSGRDRAIYIILMSSNADQKHLVNALDSGADDFIGKPPAGEELYARLRAAERLLRLQRDLMRLAMVDPLTGVFNRRAFFEKTQPTCQRASGSHHPVAIMFDVDYFKKVNDTHGHDVGDQVLRGIGREALNERAIVGRLGGEEFAVVLDGCTIEEGVAYADELRTRFAGLSFEAATGRMSITCSFGVAECQPAETIDRLLKRADAALYEAKSSGRDRVVAAQQAGLDEGQITWSGVLRSGRDGATERPGAAQPSPQPQAEPAPDGASSARVVRINPTPLGRAYVLDDDAQIGALVCKVLGACGLQSRQFTAPEPFLEEVKVSSPDLIVLDLALGQSDAVEVIHDLELISYRGKVLLISGRDASTLAEIAQIGERHGLSMLPPLKKPFRPADLKQRLSSPVAEKTQSAAQTAEGGAAAASGAAVVSLADALRNNWLELWYQPKINLKSLAVCGAEGLIRARHPAHGIIAPAKLLPPPGHPDYQPLTRFVIEQAMADWNEFARQGTYLKLSINAPFSIIQSPSFIPLLRSTLPDDPKFPGLIIEVTEDEVIRDSASAREVASQLKLYNVGLSIDDFGAAYASLSRLNDLPVVEVKIDRSFVSGCSLNPLVHGLCQTAVDLAHRFGASACAEGVESAEDLRAVIGMDCDTAQGFMFAKPMPANELASMLRAGPGQWAGALTTVAHPERRLVQRA